MFKRALVLVVLLCAHPASAAEKLTVMLDWFINPDHGPIIVAQEMGYFAAAGLDVTIIAPADANDPPKLVAAGRADLAISYQPQLYMLVAEGLPLKRVGTLVATPLNSLVVLADGPVKSIADLKGKRIGYSVAGFEETMLGAMLKKHGLTLREVQLVNVNFALTTALMSGQVQGVIGAFRNFELTDLDLHGKAGRAFFPEEEGVPPYDELIVVAHKDKTNDPRIRAFLGAVELGVQYMVNHPNEAWAAFLKSNRALNDELNKRAWADTLPRFAHSPAAFDRARYERFAQFLVQEGLIKQALPVEQYAVEVR
jgi:putative hydroxymethylpyrimidine transport system substrate-binding protein